MVRAGASASGSDYRPLLIGALRAREGHWAADAAPEPPVPGAGVDAGHDTGIEVGGVGPTGAARSPPHWRWNSRHDGATLASVYARMSGELVAVGTRVDAFA